jgi:hypothetical protein
MQFTAELGNSSFSLPLMSIPWAIGIERPGLSATSYQPTTGNAMLLNTSFPVGIAGHDQNPSLPIDSIQEAGNLAFPGVAAPLWGYATPLGEFTPQAAAYTTETGAAGNGGIGITLTVPSGFTLTGGQREYAGVQMPLNSTTEIGVGVMFSVTGALPYYFVSSAYMESETLYVSASQTLTAGTIVTLEAQGSAGGTWSFTENGALITNSGTGATGTLSLNLATAQAFIGTSFVPSSTTFGISAFPMFGLYGNGTMSVLNASSALQFSEPGRGWVLADYADGWCWNMTQQTSGEVCSSASSSIGIEGNLQDAAKIPRGEVLLGTGVQYKMTTPASVLWAGVLSVSVTASKYTLVPGQVTNLTANVTAQLAIPSSITICGSALGTCNLTFKISTSGAYWALYVATYTAPGLTSSSSMQVNVTVQASDSPDFGASIGTATLTVTPAQLVVKVTTSPYSIIAGKSAMFSIWVNDTLGPVAGAIINAVVTPGGGQGYLGTISASSTIGLYTATFSPPATMTSSESYTIVFYANSTGALTGDSQVVISVTPLPLLSVSIQLSTGSAALTGGQLINIVVTVTSGIQPVSGVQVVLASNVTWAGLASGPTNSAGVYGVMVRAPNETATTLIKVSALASLTGYRYGSAQTNVTVLVPTSTTTSSGGLGIYLYVIIGVVAAVVVVVAVLFLMKKRKPAPAVAQPEAAPQGGYDQGGYVQPDAGWSSPPGQPPQ